MYVVLHMWWWWSSGQDVFRLMSSVIFSSCWQLQTSVTKKSESWKYPSRSRHMTKTFVATWCDTSSISSSCPAVSTAPVACGHLCWYFINFCSKLTFIDPEKTATPLSMFICPTHSTKPYVKFMTQDILNFLPHNTKLDKEWISIIFSRTLYKTLVTLWHWPCRPETRMTSVCASC